MKLNSYKLWVVACFRRRWSAARLRFLRVWQLRVCRQISRVIKMGYCLRERREQWSGFSVIETYYFFIQYKSLSFSVIFTYSFCTWLWLFKCIVCVLLVLKFYNTLYRSLSHTIWICTQFKWFIIYCIMNKKSWIKRSND